MAGSASQLQAIVRKYRLAGMTWPASSNAIADWAMPKGLWHPHPSAARRQCARELARAMRQDYITDAKGRRVRAMHAVTRRESDRQTFLWDDVRTAPREHMALAFMQRRERIVQDCRQLSLDAASYNDAHPKDEPIQIVFDFMEDLLELEAAEAA